MGPNELRRPRITRMLQDPGQDTGMFLERRGPGDGAIKKNVARKQEQLGS